MLTTPMVHPELIAALAASGHGSKVLITDGNYPSDTGVPPSAKRVYLNLRPGLLTVPQVLKTLAATIPIEAAEYMRTADGGQAPAVSEYREMLDGVDFTGHERFDFYDVARQPLTSVAVVTGDVRQYANLLVTVGVRTAPTGQGR